MINEENLIKRYFTSQPLGRGVVIGPGDDAAVVVCEARGDEEMDQGMVMTADALVSGCHFESDTPSEDIGYKSLAVNLSDIAAMGASPRWATLCLSLPCNDEDKTESWLEGFSTGFLSLAARWDVALVGGDLVRGEHMAAVQLVGAVGESGVLPRSSAIPGDGIYITGDIGDAGLAWRTPDRFATLPLETRRHCDAKSRRPTPRVEEGKVLSRWASAAIDVSDGFLIDLSRLLDASDVSAQIEVERIPRGRGVCSLPEDQEHWDIALTGGEDYELLFTMADNNLAAVQREFARRKLAEITRVGCVIEKPNNARESFKCTLNGEAWPLPSKLGFDHFAR